jgi:hypothetical protein
MLLTGDFWAALAAALDASPEVRGTVATGIAAVLSIPMALVGQGLKWLPDWLVQPARIPYILAVLGWLAGFTVGHYTPLPSDLSIMAGTLGGAGSKVARDGYRTYSARKLSRGDR